MSSIRPDPPENSLLAALPYQERKGLMEECEPVDLVLGKILVDTGDPIGHVYFPTNSFISLMTRSDDGTSLEVALIGNEGMFGVSLILGVEASPLHALVQGAGPALRLEAESFLRQLERSSTLQRTLKRYLYVTMVQFAQAAACTRFHLLEPRLARWLLMTQDRAHSDTFRLTHAFLAHMLGVRRVGITQAAKSLRSRNLIGYHRGNITVLDRDGLEAAACDCYASDTAAYTRTMESRVDC